MARAHLPPDMDQCGCCGQLIHLRKKTRKISEQLALGKLPPSDFPWIAVRWQECVIFANQEWSPFVLYPDGTLESIEAHLPERMR